METKKYYVSEPYLPPIDDFFEHVRTIYKNKWLTNNGSFHQRLEQELTEYLGVPYISLFSNGTIALITALKALNMQGEIITTPFSFVATSHAISWNGNIPVFADISSDDFNIHPETVEKLINKNTVAILPVHVYGTPCDVNGFQKLSEKYNVKLIYDAAHAFNVKYNGMSILNYGEFSILSFHATKVFNTFEGGAIISKDINLKRKIDQLKNFGFVDEITVTATGINGKMNEIQAAYGILQLEYIDDNISKRKKAYEYYVESFEDFSEISIPLLSDEISKAYNYFPVLIPSGSKLSRDWLYEELKKYNIFARRYFYPLISEFPMYKNLETSNKSNLQNAYRVSSEILCLPLHAGLTEADVKYIADSVKKILQKI